MSRQVSLFQNEIDVVRAAIEELLKKGQRPSAWELLDAVQRRAGSTARFCVEDVLCTLLEDGVGTVADREYIRDLLSTEDLRRALHGDAPPRRDSESSIDALIHASKVYGESGKFQEAVRFMARFKNYSPFNNLLVWLQNPTCQFFATRMDWKQRFRRSPKEDARPMIILAPMHPVLLVYERDETLGAPIPEHISNSASVAGTWNSGWWRLCVENAEKDAIRISVRPLPALRAAYVARVAGPGTKMRIVVREGLGEAGRFFALCHELAHVYLGHLGSDEDGWWPSRTGIDRRSMEVEAEAAAYVAASRLGLEGTSAGYISTHLVEGRVPPGVSLDLIAKAAGRIEAMALRLMPKREGRRARRDELAR